MLRSQFGNNIFKSQNKIQTMENNPNFQNKRVFTRTTTSTPIKTIRKIQTFLRKKPKTILKCRQNNTHVNVLF